MEADDRQRVGRSTTVLLALHVIFWSTLLVAKGEVVYAFLYGLSLGLLIAWFRFR